MKRWIALMLAFFMFSGFAACGKQTVNGETSAPTTASYDALEILQTVWAQFDSSLKFPCCGGDPSHPADGTPGRFSLDNKDTLRAFLAVPAEAAESISDTATLFHAMLLNSFSCGIFHINGDAGEFANTMIAAIRSNHWLDGAPEEMLVATVNDEYVVVAFGIRMIMTAFKNSLTNAYPQRKILCNEDI